MPITFFHPSLTVSTQIEEKRTKKCIIFFGPLWTNFLGNWHCGSGIWPPYGMQGPSRYDDSQTPVERIFAGSLGGSSPNWTPVKIDFSSTERRHLSRRCRRWKPVRAPAGRCRPENFVEIGRAVREIFDAKVWRFLRRHLAAGRRFATIFSQMLCPNRTHNSVQIWKRFTMPFRRNSKKKVFAIVPHRHTGVAKKFYQRSRLLNSSTLCVFGVGDSRVPRPKNFVAICRAVP